MLLVGCTAILVIRILTVQKDGEKDVKREKMIPNYFNILPVSGKTPLVKWSDYTDREQTPAEKAELLKINPNGKIGIICGQVSRIFVLDVDGPEGEASLKGYNLPRTATVKTPHGRHYYFKFIPKLVYKTTTKTGVLPNIDVRGDGGYVVYYGWENPPYLVPFAIPPQWLIDLLPNKGGTLNTPVSLTSEHSSKVVDTLGSIKEGNRNESFCKLAGGLRARGYKIEEMFALLKPKAIEVGFPESELWTVCQSVGRYEPKAIDGQGASIEAFLQDSEPVKWICEPFFAEQSIGIIGGLPESRKSWILLDLAIECARGGGLWLKKFPVKGARVLLIDQERSKSEVQRRLRAVIAGKDIQLPALNGSLFVRSGTSTRIDLQHSFDALRKEMTDIKPTLVLVDSFATFHTKEESNRMEIQQVMERIKQLRNEFNCSVILIHHATKQSYQNHKDGQEPSYLDLAGNVAIPAAAEVCLSIVKHDEDSSFVHHTKSTLGTKAAPFLVKIVDMNEAKSKISVEAY